MNNRDKFLGLGKKITRRDFMQGVAGFSASFAVNAAFGKETSNWSPVQKDHNFYPPGLIGLRGNHAGSFEAMHSLARQGNKTWPSATISSNKHYDLIVVGAGISGLSAAYYFKKDRPNAEILILDNHDDFGGHAKRNEFQVDKASLAGYGGAQTMQEPSGYSQIVKELLGELGVDFDVFYDAYNQSFFKDNNLRAGIFFDEKGWGRKALVQYDLGCFDDFIPLKKNRLSAKKAVAQMPISDAAKEQLIFLLTCNEDQIAHIPVEGKRDYLYQISYQEFLKKDLKITENEVFSVLQDLTIDSGVGIDSVSALGALDYAGLPGWYAAGLPESESAEPYIHHFPDGNATIARKLVCRLIPDLISSDSLEDLVTAKLDYSILDDPRNDVSVRLNSTVINVQNSKSAGGPVTVSYIRDNQLERVSASKCVLACNSNVIPFICSELPAKQKEALAFQVKVPILYTNVAVKNWQAWKNLGIGAMVCPGSYHIVSMLDFPVSYGDYQFSKNENEPIIVHMERFPHVYGSGLSAREQYKRGRYELLTTPFETIERNVRDQLQQSLEDGGFNASEDIVGITVNRWSHGYSYWYNPLFDTVYDDYNDPRYPHILGRKRHGNIVIANSDSAANAMLESAIEEAYRAINEIT